MRVDVEAVAAGPGTLHGLCPRSGLLTDAQRVALHQLHLPEQLDELAARVLWEIIDPGSVCSEAMIGGTGIALQQQGLARRRTGGLYLQLTADVEDGLLLDEHPFEPRYY